MSQPPPLPPPVPDPFRIREGQTILAKPVESRPTSGLTINLAVRWLMVLLTILFVLAVPVCWMAAWMHADSQWESVGGGMYLERGGQRRLATRDAVSDYRVGAAIGGAICPAVPYFGGMLLLGVIWFATRE